MILTIFFFILLIGILVLVHEFGHFFVAKKLGIRVEEFAFGFPPRIISVVRGGTRYALNLLPLGGYVKIFGEAGEGEGEKESFITRAIWQRFLVIVAGVLMNLILAWFFFSIGSGLGLPTAVTPENEALVQNAKVGIIGVDENSPARLADIRFGDIVKSVEVNGEKQEIWEIDDLQKFIAGHAGKEITLNIERGKEPLVKKAISREVPPEREGPLGVALAKIGIIRTPWYLAWWEGLKTVSFTVVAIVFGFFGLFRDLFATGKVSADVSGPVGIFLFARQFTELGFIYLLQLAALLSVNLAILNALPFPALDGGRILFLAIEKIKGSKVDQRIEKAIHTFGFVILILLMLAITYRDIVKVF
ncbi:MAG: M50 family metallopeptidase [bacterium]|nr:M50 family metallopeptidase [bacterium]